MAKTKHKSRVKATTENNHATAPSGKPSRSGPARSERSRMKDALFGILVCIVFFGILEATLRLVGLPASRNQGDPFVGFSGLHNLYDVKDGIAATSPAKLRYFNAATFKVPKPAGTFRAFCFGGSTTYGHPFDARSSFSRWLEDLLKAGCSGRAVEVLNAGGISYASYRIVPLIRETLRYQPDLMIIYTGHNEFLERRTYSGLLSQGTVLLRIRSWLEQLRIYQAMRIALDRVIPAPGISSKSSAGPRASSPDAGKTVLAPEVTAVLDRSAGLELYHRDKEFESGVVAHFRHNLQQMLELCKTAGVPVIVVQPGSNLKDFSPFKSEHTAGTSVRESSEMAAKLAKATGMIDKGNFQDALTILDDLVRRDRAYADYYYWRGKALLGMKRTGDALSDFIRAKDLDVCPLRCTSDMEKAISEIAARQSAILIPFKDTLDKKALELGDKSGIPGDETFLDHVHPTIEMHQVLASRIMDEIIGQGLIRDCRQTRDPDRQSVFAKGMASFDKQFMLLRDLNLAKTLRWAGKYKEARTVLERIAPEMPDNPEVHKMLGSFLVEDGRYPEAVKAYARAVKLSGNEPQMVFSYAVACHKAGMRQDAERAYRSLIDSKDDLADAFANLATLMAQDGRLPDALKILESGMRKHPAADVLFAPYGLALAMSGRIAEAIPWTTKAVEAEPGNPVHLYNLAGMFAVSGDSGKAMHSLESAISKGYSNSDKMSADPVFDSIRNTDQFRRLLERISKKGQ